MKSLVLCLWSLLCFSLNIQSQTLNEGLIAHYKPANSFDDLSGNQNNATETALALTDDHFQNPLSAIELDGIEDEINITPSANFKPNTFPVTVSAWVRYTGDFGGGIFCNNYMDDHYFGVLFNINSETETLQISYGDGGVCDPASRRTLTGSTSVADGEWHLLTGIIRAQQDMSLYIDCREDPGSYSGTGGPITYNDNMGTIGVIDQVALDNDNFHLGGDIEEVRFYDRELSADEICELYNLPYSNIAELDHLPNFLVVSMSNGGIRVVGAQQQTLNAFKIYNSIGELVFHRSVFSTEHTIELSFKSGVYYISAVALHSGQQTLVALSFVVP